jgi:hypothetical protein
MVDPQHEPAAFASRRVLYVGAALLVSLSVIAGAILAVVRKPHSAQRNAAIAEAAPQPPLQDDPVADLAAYHREKSAQLTSYAWIDRHQGTVRIPIDRAMDIVAQRRAPANGSAHP